MSNVEGQLAAISMMTSEEMKDEWQRVTKAPCPRLSRKLLILALAWEIQAKAYGGLSRATQQKLAQLADGKSRTTSISPGMQLAREWQGKIHVVTVGEDNVVRWNDRDYRSLSEVARAITGTRWSGPAFFGLKRKLAA